MPKEKKSIVSLVQKKKNTWYMLCPTLPLFKPVSVLLEVSFGIFVSLFRPVPVHFGKSWHRSRGPMGHENFKTTEIVFF